MYAGFLSELLATEQEQSVYVKVVKLRERQERKEGEYRGKSPSNRRGAFVKTTDKEKQLDT